MIEVEAVRELLSKATPGPWYAEDGGKVWQLFARRIMPLPEGTPDELRELMPDGMEGHPLQLIKAAKEGTPYAEYWPESGDAALIAAAPDLAALALAQAAEIARLQASLRAVLDEAWDGYTVYTVEPETLKAAQETLYISEMKR